MLIRTIFSISFISGYLLAGNNKTCEIIGQQLSQPVTDYTGKTVYTKRTTTWKCNEVLDKIIGYRSYNEKKESGNYALNMDVGYETKDFSGNFAQALGMAQSLEQMQHIWSGWNGECEYGTFTDFSWASDPFFWAGVAGSMYTSAAQGWFGDGAANLVNNATRNIGELAGGTAYYGNGDMGGGIDLGGATSEGFWPGSKLIDTANQNAGIAAGTTSWSDSAIQNLMSPGTLVSSAFNLASFAAPPTQQEQQSAWDYSQSWTGQSSSDVASNAFNSCMASIGLSFSNTVSWSAGADESVTGSAIQRPWDNPLRISWEDWNGLQSNTGGASGNTTFTVNNYKVVSQDSIGVTLIAKTVDAYLQLGQTLCAGYRVSKSMNGLNSYAASQSSSTSSKGSVGQAVAVQLAIQGIGAACPPCGLAANIAYKFMNSFSKGDACSDPDFALTRGKIQYKTHRFLRHEQCHYVSEDCSKKLNLGFIKKCMVHKKKYCCYDQVTTRIFVEGIKEQLGRDWSNCNDLTINDLKGISFRECLTGENPIQNHCMSPAKMRELKQAIFRAAPGHGITTENITQQVQNSMAIPR